MNRRGGLLFRLCTAAAGRRINHQGRAQLPAQTGPGPAILYLGLTVPGRYRHSTLRHAVLAADVGAFERRPPCVAAAGLAKPNTTCPVPLRPEPSSRISWKDEANNKAASFPSSVPSPDIPCLTHYSPQNPSLAHDEFGSGSLQTRRVRTEPKAAGLSAVLDIGRWQRDPTGVFGHIPLARCSGPI